MFLAPRRWWVAASLQRKEIARDVNTGTGSQLVGEMGRKGRECPLVSCQDLGTEDKWDRQATEKGIISHSDKAMLDNLKGIKAQAEGKQEKQSH